MRLVAFLRRLALILTSPIWGPLWFVGAALGIGDTDAQNVLVGAMFCGAFVVGPLLLVAALPFWLVTGRAPRWLP